MPEDSKNNPIVKRGRGRPRKEQTAPEKKRPRGNPNWVKGMATSPNPQGVPKRAILLRNLLMEVGGRKPTSAMYKKIIQELGWAEQGENRTILKLSFHVAFAAAIKQANEKNDIAPLLQLWQLIYGKNKIDLELPPPGADPDGKLSGIKLILLPTVIEPPAIEPQNGNNPTQKVIDVTPEKKIKK